MHAWFQPAKQTTAWHQAATVFIESSALLALRQGTCQFWSVCISLMALDDMAGLGRLRPKGWHKKQAQEQH